MAKALAATLVVSLSGCLNPWTTRMPTCWTRSPELERREAQIQDPYPDTKWGPDVGFRPLAFQEQRSEPQRAKDRFYSTMLRTQQAPSAGPPAPVGPGAYVYPGFVY